MSALTLDQQHYFAHGALRIAEAKAAKFKTDYIAACLRARTDVARRAAGELANAYFEWCGIARACAREVARIARLRQGTT